MLLLLPFKVRFLLTLETRAQATINSLRLSTLEYVRVIQFSGWSAHYGNIRVHQIHYRAQDLSRKIQVGQKLLDSI